MPELEVQKAAERRFKIMAEHMSGQTWAGGTIPWAMIAPHAAQVEKNHYQSLDRVAERGGLSWSEALAVLEDRPWKAMGADDAKPAVLALVEAWEKANA